MIKMLKDKGLVAGELRPGPKTETFASEEEEKMRALETDLVEARKRLVT